MDMIPSLRFDWPWYEFLLWNAATFVVSFFPNSFFEWISHRWVLHSKAIVGFAYQEHDRVHHVDFGADQSFHVPQGDKAYGVDFKFRDWTLFLVIMIPVWLGVELLVGKPLILGAVLSILCWLQMFNSIHRLFHEPRDSWFERTRYFQFLKTHHRRHHADTSKNLNVSFIPIADFFLRSIAREKEAPAAPQGTP